MNKDKYRENIAGLQIVLGRQITDKAIELYWNVLNFMSDEDFERATRRLTTEFKPTSANPFPVPANFIESSGASLEDRAQLAIATVKKAIMRHGRYSSVDFGDAALHNTISRFGGWVAICGWNDQDWQINTKSFIAAYNAFDKHCEIDAPKYLPGIVEMENGNTFEGYVPTPVLMKPDKVKMIEENKE